MKIIVTKELYPKTNKEYFSVKIQNENGDSHSSYTFDTYPEVKAFQSGFSEAKYLANSLIQSLPSTFEMVQVRQTWTEIKSPILNHNGHTFWKDGTGNVAVADQSMRYKARPDSTDDGLLFLDYSRPLKVIKGGERVIPLLSPNGSKTSTLASDGDIEVCKILGMKFENS